MKIVSVITGIGYGHTIRQKAVLRELERRGAEIVVASYGNSLEYFEHIHKTLEIEGPSLPERNARFSMLKTLYQNINLPIIYIKNFFKLRRLFKAFNPDAIICDFEPLPLFMERKRLHFIMFNFNPIQYGEYLKDRNKSYWAQRKYISIIYNRAKRIGAKIIVPSFKEYESSEIEVINPIIRRLPKLSKQELLEKLDLKKQPILIMFGGSHFSTELIYLLQDVLTKFDEKFIIFTYKISGTSHKNVTFMPFKENFLEYLKASKGIITQAGHLTLSECIALKKPSLIFPIPDLIEQELNAYFAKKSGISIVERKKDYSEGELQRIIGNFIKAIPTLKDNLDKIDIELNGAKQAADIVEEEIKSRKENKIEVSKEKLPD